MEIPAGVLALINAVIDREGRVYVNDPDDRGHATKYGITIGTLSEWRGHQVSDADVAALTEAEAIQIYAKRFYYGPGFDAVTDPLLQSFLFDWGVNSGPGTAAKGLQTVLAHSGVYTGAIDGGIGPMTRAACAKITNTTALFFAVKAERLEFLLRDIGHYPPDAKYGAGWANRNDQFDSKIA